MGMRDLTMVSPSAYATLKLIINRHWISGYPPMPSHEMVGIEATRDRQPGELTS